MIVVVCTRCGYLMPIAADRISSQEEGGLGRLPPRDRYQAAFSRESRSSRSCSRAGTYGIDGPKRLYARSGAPPPTARRSASKSAASADLAESTPSLSSCQDLSATLDGSLELVPDVVDCSHHTLLNEAARPEFRCVQSLWRRTNPRPTADVAVFAAVAES